MGRFDFITDDILGLGFRKTEREQRANFQAALRETEEAKARRLGLEQRANVQDARALQGLITSLAKAQGVSKAAGGAVRQQARTQGQSLQGRAQLSAFDRGLVGTSGGKAMTAAAQREAARGTGQVESQLAQLEAQLGLSGGQAIAGQRNLIANRFMQQGQAAQAGARDLTNLRGSLQIDNMGAQFLNALASMAGSAMGA